MRPRVIRKRSNGTIQIRRRRVADVFITREFAGLALLMGTWAIGIAALVGSLLTDVVMTSMVILLGTVGVSAAIATTRTPRAERVQGRPKPPPDRAA